MLQVYHYMTVVTTIEYDSKRFILFHIDYYTPGNRNLSITTCAVEIKKHLPTLDVTKCTAVNNNEKSIR